MKSTKIVVAILLISMCSALQAGKIVVTNDEFWASNQGFSQSPDSAVFATNIASFFASGGLGSFHAYSVNFSLTESSLASTLTNAGHSFSSGFGIPFDLATISGFDGIFMSSSEGVPTFVLDYVNAGGSLLVVGGTTSNVAVVIPTWNPFLSNFGIGFVPAVNSLVGNIDVISGTHPIFNGVSILNHDGGYNIAGVGLQVLNSDGTGQFAVIDTTATPEPSTLVLLGLGLVVVVYARRRNA